MKNFARKLRLIFIPYLIIALGCICFCALLSWLLFIKEVFIVDEMVPEFWIPIIVPGIPILIWLRPRIKLLNLYTSYSSKNPLTGYIMLSWFAIAVPSVIAQQYVETATGKLTNLGNIYEINSLPKTKYYTVKDFYINKRMAHVFTFFSTSNKGRDFDMTLFAPVPVFDHLFPDTSRITYMRNNINMHALIIINGNLSTMAQLKKLPADSIRMMKYMNPSFTMPKYGDAGKYGALAIATMGYKITWKLPVSKIDPVAWLGVRYTKTINNSLSQSDKNRCYKEFLLQSENKFNHTDFNKFVYLDRVSNKRVLKNYYKAIKSKGDVDNDAPIILLPVNQPFENRNGKTLAWVMISFVIGSLMFLISLLFKPLNYKKVH